MNPEDYKNLPGYNAPQKFPDGSIVITPAGVKMFVKWKSGAQTIDGAWVNKYRLIPMNRDGSPSKRKSSVFNHEFLETQLSAA